MTGPRGITLYPEWAEAVVRGWKTREVRPVRPCRDGVPATGWVAIHAGKHQSNWLEVPLALRDRLVSRYDMCHGFWRDYLAQGAIVGFARIDEWHRAAARDAYDIAFDGGECCLSGTMMDAPRGGFHWVIGAAFALPVPVPCRGQQGLWPLNLAESLVEAIGDPDVVSPMEPIRPGFIPAGGWL